MSFPQVLDSQGRSVPLGPLLGKGGEGAVYEVQQTTVTVAKIYHKPLTQERSDKIKTMVAMRTDTLSKLTSWPSGLLLSKDTAQPIGLLMPRIADRVNVHHLYGPKSRLQDFPKADWRFLIRASANVARAFATVHDAGCVIGDVNHGSIMVGKDATVRLIDCDSFQVTNGSRKFLCEVGIETFTPPELQGLSFRGVVRTPDYDNFGLAVMIFHLLFMGRHPFAGRFAGAGEMPIARAIKEGRFPYSTNHRAMQMEQPPGTPPLALVGADAAHLFESAFSQASIKTGRPTARDWIAAMRALEGKTKRCSADPGHWYTGHLSPCPWCRMESLGAKSLFPFVSAGTAATQHATLNVDSLIQQLEALPFLGPVQLAPSPGALPSQAALLIGRPKLLAKPLSILIAALIFVGGTIIVPALFWAFAIAAAFVFNVVHRSFVKSSEIERLSKALSDAQMAFNRSNSDWQERASDNAYQAAKRRVYHLKCELDEIPVKRLKSLDQIRQNQRRLQLDRFLEKFEIEDAKIDGIGAGRKRTLESYGIETAEDVQAHRLSGVPGFGPKMSERLLKWRRSCEARFIFDPAKAVDPRDQAKVEADILALRIKSEAAVKQAFAEALQAHSRAAAARQAMQSQLESLQAAVAQANADYKFVSGS